MLDLEPLKDQCKEQESKRWQNTTGNRRVESTPHCRVYSQFLYFGHVFATRLGAIFFLDDASAFDYKFVGAAYSLAPMNTFPIYLCVFGVAGGWHLVYGSYSALATLSGSTVAGKVVPLTLKVMALASHIAIVSAVMFLGYYMKSIDMSDGENARLNYFHRMGM